MIDKHFYIIVKTATVCEGFTHQIIGINNEDLVLLTNQLRGIGNLNGCLLQSQNHRSIVKKLDSRH